MRIHGDQLSFENFLLRFGSKLSGDNHWIKLAELIPCDELEDEYASQFCKGFGAPAKPFRMALGALIIKAAWQFSAPFDPSMMVSFRKRLPESMINN